MWAVAVPGRQEALGGSKWAPHKQGGMYVQLHSTYPSIDMSSLQEVKVWRWERKMK